MPRYASSVYLPVSPAEAWAWHARPSSIARRTPPWAGIRITEAHADLVNGSRQLATVPVGPLRMQSLTEYTDCHPEVRFGERQVRGPFRSWEYVQFFQDEDDGCRLIENIEYHLPGGALGHYLAAARVDRRTEMISAWQHQRVLADLGRHHDYRQQPHLRVAISGATGLVGSDLAAFLASGGHTVVPFLRSRAAAGPGIYWDPLQGVIDQDALAGCDAVIHLAGEPIAQRWTTSRRERIRDSRVVSTRLLAETLAAMPVPPRVLVVASAVGWYGDRHEEYVDEMSSPGTGFLAEVCAAWEDACAPARAAGIRVVNVRTGMVISGKGGALPKMLSPYRFGLGAILGSGDQWVSWIALDDLVYLIHHVLHSKSVKGPVNAVAPAPVRQRDLAKILGRIVGHAPHLRLSEGVLRGLVGEMAREVLTAGCRVISRQLEQETFAFSSPDLEQALRWELGRFVLESSASEPMSDSSWST